MTTNTDATTEASRSEITFALFGSRELWMPADQWGTLLYDPLIDALQRDFIITKRPSKESA